MLFSCGICRIGNMGRIIFSRKCAGYVAPPPFSAPGSPPGQTWQGEQRPKEEKAGYHPRAASEEQILGVLKAAAADLGVTGFTARFLMSEWLNVVDAWQVPDGKSFQSVLRLGRKARLGAKQRQTLWPIFERARAQLTAQGLLTWPMIFGEVTSHFSRRTDKPFTHAVVDEAQDLGVPELRMLSAIVPPGADRLFFAGTLASAFSRSRSPGKRSASMSEAAQGLSR